MTKYFLMAIAVLAIAGTTQAQVNRTDSSSVAVPGKKKLIDLSDRPNDHFLVQLGFDGWSASGLALGPSGFSRHFNIYFMLDKPSKNNPHISVGYGVGLGTSNMFFKDVFLDIRSRNAQLPITDVSSNANGNRFKKFKLATQYLEIPLELRYVANAENPGKGFKIAGGLKLGYLLKAYTKGKNAIDNNGASLYSSSYIEKEYDKHYFNSTKVAATLRIGLGIVSIDGSYQLTNLLKDAAGPNIRPYSIGITFSGL